MPLGPESPLNAMMSGMAQGDAAARSILPNAYQPRGKAQANNPFQGTIDSIIDQILQIAYEVRGQGDANRDCVDRFYKVTFDLAKINKDLSERAEGEEDSGG